MAKFLCLQAVYFLKIHFFHASEVTESISSYNPPMYFSWMECGGCIKAFLLAVRYLFCIIDQLQLS